MESNRPSASTKRKRPMISELSDSDSESDKPTAEKRVRFPKGKKARPGDETVQIRRGAQDDDDDDEVDNEKREIARTAAKERELRRKDQRAYDKVREFGIGGDVSAAEVSYEGLDYENFVEDGIQMEPFNLEKEREEGYFDANGNFVEFAPDESNKVEDAWLDSIEAGDTKLYDAQKTIKDGHGDENGQDLAASDDEEDIGKIKRRIANVLEEGETVLQALRRLKGGSSSNKKEKMPEETKRVFDQLTEDALTLMDKHGEYDVNSEKKEIFEREAEGYESLARARSGGGSSVAVAVAAESANAEDGYDMFGDEEGDNATAEPSIGGGDSAESDYVFDDASGYYYSSSLGYYYDPNTGLYCSAASGIWYSYNEDTGAYDEVPPHDQAAAAAAPTGVN